MIQRVSLRRLLLWVGMILVCSVPVAAQWSRECCPPEPYPPGGWVNVAVIGDERGTLAWSGGDRYGCRAPSPMLRVSARQGERYRLRIENDSGYEVGLVVSVDGRNVVTGDRSYGHAREGMYVLRAGGAWTSRAGDRA
jgi:hypothetical protein